MKSVENALKSINGKIQSIKARSILWYLLFTLSMVDFMCRITINIAIINMVVPRHEMITIETVGQCFAVNSTTSNNLIVDDSIRGAPKELFSLERAFLNWLKVNICYI